MTGPDASEGGTTTEADRAAIQALEPVVSDDLPAGPRPMIAIVDAAPGRQEALRAAVVDLTRGCRSEPGCLAFIPYADLDVPGRFHLYEVYADTAAFRDHLRTDHVHRFWAALLDCSTVTDTAGLTQLVEVDVGQPASPVP